MRAVTDAALVLAVVIEPTTRPRDTDAKIRYTGRLRRVTLDVDDTLGVIIGGDFFPLDESTHERVNRTLAEGADPGPIVTPTVILPPATPRTPPVPDSLRVRYLRATADRPARVQTRDPYGKLVIADMPDTRPTAKEMNSVTRAAIRDMYSHAEATHDFTIELFPYHATVHFTRKATA